VKRIISYILPLVLIIQILSAAQTTAVQADAAAEDIYMDISDYYNSTLYTQAGTALGPDLGSGLYFPSECVNAYEPETAEGTGIDVDSLEEMYSGGILTASGGSTFRVDTSGAVMMGNNEFKVWEFSVNEKAYGVDILMFCPGTMHSGGFNITAYYDDGTIEDDCALTVEKYSIETDNSIAVTAIKATTGVKNSRTAYAHVLSMELKNQYTNLKNISKIRIEYGHSRYGAAFMAVTLKANPKQYNYSSSECMDISEYCTGEYAAASDFELQSLYSGFIYGSKEHINYDYIEKLTNLENKFMYDGVVYQLPPKEQRFKGIFSNETAEKQIDVPVKAGYYDKLYMLVNTVSYEGEKPTSGQSKVKDIPVEIVYSDGTCTTEYINVGYEHARAYYNTGTDDVTPAIIAGSIQYDISNNTLNSKTVGTPEDYRGLIFSTEVPVSENKPVVRVRVGSEAKWVYMYSLTGIKKDSSVSIINEQIDELLLENVIYDTMLPIINMTEEMIDAYVSNGGAYTDIEKYDDFQELKSLLESQINAKGYLEIFVSSNTLVNGNGSELYPVSSIKAAKEKVEENKDVLNNDKEIHVVFLEGEYSVDSTYLLEKEDGTDTGKIVYRAKDGDNVIFLGTTTLNKEDFKKVTDETILKRLPQSARDKVYGIDLDAYGIALPEYSPDSTPILFADGEAQKIAAYPNEGYTSIESSDITETGYSSEEYTQVKLYDEDGNNFTDLKGAYAEGFFAYDYDYKKIRIADFDKSGNILTVEGKNSINCSQYPTKPRRLRIVNSLETLDAPEEWYCDSDSNVVYWLPQNFENVQDISVTVRNDAVFKIKNAKNIQIKNFNFFGNLSNAIEITNSENILIEDCEFSDISLRAVMMTNHKNTVVRNNVIHDCAMGIVGKTGNFKTLENYGNSIANNHIYKIGYGSRAYRTTAIQVTDVGCRIVNNTIHDMPDASVKYNGNDIYIAYNEIYDVCKETNDASAVYSGNKYTERGTVIEYNYFHDIMPQYNWTEGKYFKGDTFTSGFAVYFDDYLCSQTARKNIIVNVACPADINGGQFNTFEDNIIVNTLYNAFLVTSRGMNDQNRKEREAAEWASLSAEAQEIYKQKYTELALGPEYCSTLPANNTASNNLIIDAAAAPSITQENYDYYGQFENNMMYSSAEFDGFNNIETGDYRIKRNSDILNTLPGLISVDTLSMLDIGSSLVKLPEYNEKVNALTKTELDEVYEALRRAVSEGRTQWNMYVPIVNKKGETDKVSVNGIQIKNNVFNAVLNIADIDNAYSYDFILAVYDGNKLAEVRKVYQGVNEAISDVGVQVSAEIGNVTGKTVKCFAWDSLGRMCPLSECIIR